MKLLTINECAETLKFSRWTVTELLETGALPGIVLKSGRRKKVWRVRESELERWLTAREQETKKLISGERALKAV
jgi:excisionase family DNA binding protein